METPASLLAFWFGQGHTDAQVATEQNKLWWSKDPELDQLIRTRFAPTLHSLEQGKLQTWTQTAEGMLALILLTDQFPRNMFRDSGQAFAYDPQARAWCKQGLAENMPSALRPIQQVFFYMPLEHSEELSDQEQAVHLFTGLREQVDEAQRPVFERFLDFACRHRDIIQRFGRFPHRNAALGREPTAAELAFLQQKGSSF